MHTYPAHVLGHARLVVECIEESGEDGSEGGVVDDGGQQVCNVSHHPGRTVPHNRMRILQQPHKRAQRLQTHVVV